MIGRSSANEIAVHSGALSRNHTRILFVDDGYLLQDMGSTNGSRVNHASVSSAKLAHGDVVELGDAVFRFELVK